MIAYKEAKQTAEAFWRACNPFAEFSAMRDLQPLTAKPVLFVANVDEGDDTVPPAVAEHAAAIGALAVAVSSRLEAELSELDDEDASAMRADMGVGESGLRRVVDGAFALPDTVVIDDRTGTPAGLPLAAGIQAALQAAGLPLAPPARTQPAGNNVTPGTRDANLAQQRYFTDAIRMFYTTEEFSRATSTRTTSARLSGSW